MAPAASHPALPASHAASALALPTTSAASAPVLPVASTASDPALPAAPAASDPALPAASVALQNQGATIGQHEQLLQQMAQQLSVLVEALQVRAAASPTPSTVAAPTETPSPAMYAGAPEGCRGFLLQCSLVFEQQPSRFPTERSKVAYMISLLTGRALAWATALWEQASPDCDTGTGFAAAMRQTFYNPVGGREAASRRCLRCCSGSHRPCLPSRRARNRVASLLLSELPGNAAAFLHNSSRSCC
uniref:DUF4939 domain-containing protein n=1 Tax=Astyanax mexicanus TaxID=7994 RepID=A0A8B9L0P6_ASTMX